jgi:hypothetical protein
MPSLFAAVREQLGFRLEARKRKGDPNEYRRPEPAGLEVRTRLDEDLQKNHEQTGAKPSATVLNSDHA